MTRIIRRPRLLARAAKAGAACYRRERDLSKLLPKAYGKGGRVLAHIKEAEEACEMARKAGAASYSAARHVSILSALLAESAAASA